MLSVTSRLSASPERPCRRNVSRDQVGQVGAGELTGREVDGHPAGRAYAVPLPRRHLPAGLVEHPRSELDDETGLLGHRDELARLEQPTVRVLPPDQRLDTEQRGRRDVDDRLVVQDELTGVDAEAELALDVDPLHRLAAHLAVEQRHSIAAQVLGLVHRDVGVADQRPRVDCRAARQCDADARRHLDGVRLVADRLRGGSDHAAADAHGVVRSADALAEHGELVTAEPRDGVPGRTTPSSRIATVRSRRSPHLCPSESLTVLKWSRSKNRTATAWSVATELVERHLETVHEQVAVGQSGQLVVRRLIAEQLTRDVLVGDVLHDAPDADDGAVHIGYRRKARDEVRGQVGVARAREPRPPHGPPRTRRPDAGPCTRGTPHP